MLLLPSDSHFQVNLLSQMHLALTLLPLLQATPNARLVLQSSDLHRAAPGSIAFDSLQEVNTDIGATYLYNRSKLAQVLFVRALVRRMQQRRLGFRSAEQVWANASNPGANATDQQKQADDAYGKPMQLLTAITRPFMKDALEEGCRPALFAATSDDIVKDKVQGSYVRFIPLPPLPFPLFSSPLSLSFRFSIFQYSGLIFHVVSFWLLR
jgi:NAD(P)-dependent dehydrogenase (short-subunit alcohol dehydrogenase family)